MSTKVLVGDFETTVYEGQTDTRVWAAACVELYTEDVSIYHSIGELFTYLASMKCNVDIYFHNLKFDGAFWLSYLLCDLGYQQAYTQSDKENDDTIRWLDKKDMTSKSFKYVISDMGQWYSITIKHGKYFITIKDSLKLLPFSVKRIGESFKTKHQKLDMEYKGLRYPGCVITDEEKKYISNDVLVVKEALEIMFNEGHNRLTIGACCLNEYKKIVSKQDFDELFPDLYKIKIDKSFGAETAGDYIRKSYKGGWCYLVKGKENKIYKGGTTADVNSLYPSMMSSESGNCYPVGKPKFWKGDFIPDEALMTSYGGSKRYYFVRIRTRFKIKDNYLPCIQVKSTLRYLSTDWLETSDILQPILVDGKRVKDENGNDVKRYFDYYIERGEVKPATVELTLTCTDYELIKEHYNLDQCEILDGCWFYSQIGIFDQYIEKYKKQKLESTGARRELAKLFLNNLYGKMASSTDSSFKVAEVRENGAVGFFSVKANDKEPGYIACGSAITSYARNFTIRTAQKNYHGKTKRGFIYADTDSIHCDLQPDELDGVPVHDKDFCHWKLESCWDEGFFVRQKTYIEHVTHENLQPIDKPFYNIKCAGMPQQCKDLFQRSMDGRLATEHEELPPEHRDFLSKKRELTDFTVGLAVPGKLMPKRIRGGVLLVDTIYEMR